MPIIREKRQSGGVGPVGVVRMNLGGAEKYAGISEATRKLTALGIEESGRQAAKQGDEMARAVSSEQIIALNPETGKPKALDWVGQDRFFGRAGADAYERVVQERFQSSMETELKTKAAEIALKYKNNPYGAEQYKAQMDEYLKSMALNSEIGGKATYYTNFIMDAGAQYIASTTLHMQEEQINRQRQVTGQSTIDIADSRVDAVREFAKLGKPAGALINSIVDSITDGENSFLLNQGSRVEYRKRAAVAYGQGIIDKNAEALGYKSAGHVATAITLGDPTGLNSQERAVFDEASKYMYRSVELDDGTSINVLDRSALTSLSPYATQTAQAEANDFQSELVAQRFQYSDDRRDLVEDSINLITGSMKMFDDGNISTHILTEKIVGQVSAAYGLNEQMGIRTTATVAEVDANNQLVRESASKQLIAIAYEGLSDKGNPQTIRNMINTALDSGNTNNLTGKAKAAIDAVIEITTTADNGFLDGVTQDYVSNDVRSSAQYASERALYQSELSSSYIKHIGNASSYTEGNELLSEFNSRVDRFEFLSATQKTNYKLEAKNIAAGLFITDQIGSYIETQDSSGATIRRKINSSDLAKAALYASNSKTPNVPAAIAGIVDSAKAKSGTPGYVEARLVQLTTRLSGDEAKEAQKNKDVEVKTRILSSLSVEDTTANREHAQSLVIEGVEDPDAYFRSAQLLNFDNKSTQVLYSSIESGVVPTILAGNLNQIANGTFAGDVDEAKNIISFYSHFARQPRDGIAVNNWNNTKLSSDTKARLEVISLLATAIDAPIVNLAVQFEQATSPAATASRINSYREEDGSTSDEQFVLNAVPDAASNVQARKLLVSLAKYLHGPMSAGDIKDTLSDYYNRTFTETEGYVMDYSSLSGFRSQYSMSSVFRNKEMKEYFINKVNIEVAIAYARSELAGTGQTRMLANFDAENRAFLLPLGSSSGSAANYMLVEKKSGTLVPVVNPMSGIPFQFSSAEPDVLEKAKELNVQRQNLLPSIDKIRDMRKQRASNANKLNGVAVPNAPAVSSIADAAMQLFGGNN
jgi:hypothetical protein